MTFILDHIAFNQGGYDAKSRKMPVCPNCGGRLTFVSAILTNFFVCNACKWDSTQIKLPDFPTPEEYRKAWEGFKR